MLVRPEQVAVGAEHRPDADEQQPRGVVVSREFHGHDVLLGIQLDQPAWGLAPTRGRPAWEILARLPGAEAPAVGQRVALQVEGVATAWLTVPNEPPD